MRVSGVTCPIPHAHVHPMLLGFLTIHTQDALGFTHLCPLHPTIQSQVMLILLCVRCIYCLEYCSIVFAVGIVELYIVMMVLSLLFSCRDMRYRRVEDAMVSFRLSNLTV